MFRPARWRLGVALVFPLIGCARLPFAADHHGSGSESNVSAPTAAVVLNDARVAPFTPAPVEVNQPPAPPPVGPIRILVGGDLIPHRPSLASPSAALAALAPLGPLFAQADSVVGNYEAATGALEKKAFRLAYAATPDWLESLPAAGIKAVTVANNHACDLDYDGVDATLEAATKGGLTVLGGDAKGDPWAPRVLAEHGGKRVCAVAWTTFLNAEGGCAKTVRLAVAPEGPQGTKKFVTALARARSTCDATVAIVHGGVEYVPQTPGLLAIARQAADAGADAVVLHHPHVASPVTVHRTKDGRRIPIFASVGNLVSNQGESWKPPMFPVLRENRRLVCVNGWTRLGVLADLAFDLADPARPRLAWGFHLLWTDTEHAEDKAPVPKISTRLLDPDKDAAIMSHLSDDEVGPVDLFDDPCWVERPLYARADGEAASDGRCEASLTRSAPAPKDAATKRKKRR
jgi:poly-gamma-glutamate synthesis protein (capsule biosynthesis protein)